MARTRFHSLLELRVKEVIVDRSAALTAGAAGSYDSYKFLVGYLEGLRDALKIADEVNEDLDT